MLIFQQFNKFKDKIQDTFLQILSVFSLAVTYLLGVGLTRLISVFVDKKFLPPASTSSQWQTTKYSDKVNNSLY
ncbi:hypothetical protein KJ707_02545 [Patescibacteria group bacterium]|nr:hypothetical protein [Patescibacteria group bacterium]